MKRNKSESIRSHLMWPLLILLLLQAVVMIGIVLFGGVSVRLKQNAIYTLNKNTENNRLYVEKETFHHWINIMNDSGSMAAEIDEILAAKGKTNSDIAQDPELNKEIVDGIIEKSIELLRDSSATGIFAVLDGPAAVNSPSGTRAGFYIRNSNVGRYAQDYSSLLMERGLPSIANKYGIPLDSFWELGFDIKKDDETTVYYRNPLESAVKNKAEAGRRLDFAYLSRPFRLSPKDMQIITYSAPIILANGSVVGVFGLEMSISQMESLLKADQPKGSFDEIHVLGIRKAGEDAVIPVASSGYLYDQYFAEETEIAYRINEEHGISELNSSDGTSWYAGMEKIDIYNNNTPFESDEWVVMSLARKNDVLSFHHSIQTMLLLSLMIPVSLAVFGIFIIGKVVTDPIRSLIIELKEKSGVHGLSLKRIHIDEIDKLTETIEQFSADAERSASKISGILEHANVPIGVFEYERNFDTVFCSRSLFEMLNWRQMEEPYCYISHEEFEKHMRETISVEKRDGENFLCYINKTNKERWFKFILDTRNSDSVLGVLSDVTADVKEKAKLERERNYDLLTNLYNRRAFKEQILPVMMNKSIQAAAVIMWDLDNLKYINDTYGHDDGDRYIVLFANCLKLLEKEGAVVSRYSGDEFVTLLYDANGKEEIRNRLTRFMEDIKTCTLEMEGGYQIPIRVSGGISWYPDDAADFDTLLSYADFAMYTVKHSVKGTVMEFNSNEYSHNAYMLVGREELNRMLETRQVSFAFQPIVTRTGEIYGYELLMRPNFTNLKGITEVLNLARAQGKLSQMETLTWLGGLAAIAYQDSLGTLKETERLFINSIASVRMTMEDEKRVEQLFGKYLSKVVIEMTEGEPVNRVFMHQKMSSIKRWGGLIALDDFGAGHNSENILLELEPNIVKVDINLIRHINDDLNRQMILNSLMDFAQKNEIQVLAEGVETREELEFLINHGVKLFQGYYIARPQMEIRPIAPYIVLEMQTLAQKSAF